MAVTELISETNSLRYLMSCLSFLATTSYYFQGNWKLCVLAGVLHFCQVIDGMGTDGYEICIG